MVKTLAFLVLLFCGFAYPARSLDPAVFTKEAGLVPGSIGPGLDCWDLLPLLLGTDCAWPSVNEQSIEVTVCVLSPDSGALVITSPDRGASFTASPGQDVFRARLVGPEINLLEVHYCSRQLAIAPYRTGITGAVHAEVLHLHSNFTFHHPTPVNNIPQLLAADYDFDTHSTLPRCDGTVPCPMCQQLHNPGRWIFNGLQPALQRTCIFPRYFDGCHGEQHTSVVGASGLKWQPLDCNLAHHDNIDIPGCLAGKHICMVGDSQVRHTFNSFVQILEGTFRDSATAEYNRMPAQSQYGTFYGDPFGEIPVYDTGCTTLIVNVGQWFASFRGGTEFDLAHIILTYMIRLREVAVRLQTAQAAGMEVIWMTTNGHAVTMHQHSQDVAQFRDWRTDPALLLTNRIANSIMAAAGIPIFDTWSMTAPVFDLSYDGAHFKGDIGYNIGLTLLNYLCKNHRA